MTLRGWKLEVHERDCSQCRICGSKHGLTVHHKVPKARGGGSNLENCVCWCKWCHCAFHNKWGLTTSDDLGNPVGSYHSHGNKKKERKRGKRRRR